MKLFKNDVLPKQLNKNTIIHNRESMVMFYIIKFNKRDYAIVPKTIIIIDKIRLETSRITSKLLW